MSIRVYYDFVLVADQVERDDSNRIRSLSVAVFDSPVGRGTMSERVRVPEELAPALDDVAARRLDVERQAWVGEVLAGLLLPSYARELFQTSLDWLREDEGIRLRLRLARELAGYPWEYLYIQRVRGERRPSDFLALDPRISIARHEAVPQGHDWFEPPTERRVILTYAAPKDYPPVDGLEYKRLALERRSIVHALRDVPGMTVEELPPLCSAENPPHRGTRVHDIVERLVEQVDILHFTGYAHAAMGLGPSGALCREASFVLSSNDNLAVLLPADGLAELVRRQGVRMVVLRPVFGSDRRERSKAWTGVAEALVSGGIPAVLFLQFPMLDELASAFMTVFHRALVAGQTVDEAVSLGRLATRSQAFDDVGHVRDWGAPVLYLGSPTGRVFNQVTGVAADQASKEHLDLSVEPHPTRVAKSQTRIDSEPTQVRVARTDPIRQPETTIEGVAGLTINLFAGPYIVQETGRSNGGTQIGMLSSGADGASWSQALTQLVDILRVTNVPIQAPGRSTEADTGEDDGPHPHQWRTCPTCGRHVAATWSFCPSCEIRLH